MHWRFFWQDVWRLKVAYCTWDLVQRPMPLGHRLPHLAGNSSKHLAILSEVCQNWILGIKLKAMLHLESFDSCTLLKHFLWPMELLKVLSITSSCPKPRRTISRHPRVAKGAYSFILQIGTWKQKQQKYLTYDHTSPRNSQYKHAVSNTRALRTVREKRH